MSEHRPAPGKYYIVNRQSPHGESLAITFNGLYNPMNVTELQKSPMQTWVISNDANGPQGISPLDGQGLFIVTGDDHQLMAWAGPGGYIWSFKKDGNTYTIEKDSEHVWDISEAQEGQSVIWSSATQAKNQQWKLVPA